MRLSYLAFGGDFLDVSLDASSEWYHRRDPGDF